MSRIAPSPAPRQGFFCSRARRDGTGCCDGWEIFLGAHTDVRHSTWRNIPDVGWPFLVTWPATRDVDSDERISRVELEPASRATLRQRRDLLKILTVRLQRHDPAPALCGHRRSGGNQDRNPDQSVDQPGHERQLIVMLTVRAPDEARMPSLGGSSGRRVCRVCVAYCFGQESLWGPRSLRGNVLHRQRGPAPHVL